jgi:hypothetical protein
LRASIGLFLLRPRALHAIHRSIDPRSDPGPPRCRWRAVGGQAMRALPARRPAERRRGRPVSGGHPRQPSPPLQAYTHVPVRAAFVFAQRGQKRQRRRWPAGAGAGRRARRWRSRASGGARPSCSGPPRTPGTRHPPPA